MVSLAFLFATQSGGTQTRTVAGPPDTIDKISAAIEKSATDTLELATALEKYAENLPLLKSSAVGEQARTAIYANSMVLRINSLKLLNAYESAFDALKVAPDGNRTKDMFWHKNLLLSTYQLVEVIPEV